MNFMLSQPPYYIGRDSFICLAGRYYVILHLAQDRYLCVERKEFESLRSLIAPRNFGTSKETQLLSADGPAPAPRIELAAELIARGILTPERSLAGIRMPLQIVKPANALGRECMSIRAYQCLRYLPTFLRSARFADNCLRENAIAHTVQRIAGRKEQLSPARASHGLNQIRTLVTAFNLLRPFFDRKYLCLFDSLALIEFLSNYSIYPSWVFAVQSEPFAAHCWVQDKDLLLNESLERARLYAPIMVV